MPTTKALRIALLTCSILIAIPTLFHISSSDNPKIHNTPTLHTNTTTNMPNQPSTIQSSIPNSPATNNPAPLTDCPSPRPQIGTYEVTLATGHILKNHKDRVGSQLDPHISHFLNPDQVVYLVGPIEDGLLDKIRGDWEVVGVRCDGSGRLEGLIRGDD
ncbi:hypothetical protein E2P81_ATG01611 [Venturia nashicola]|uniref:Uncharacterized protein n=1 Tax=Venturia nashicola TaxID=86259 RepID=A0A4Z1NYA4_9PEZI|nr:hypothetical protein E6O75_ATG01652 [Venturia nashicola]TLD18883.1 hypothetical protein E2P81_ATG01611 [Venturia nashicola]